MAGSRPLPREKSGPLGGSWVHSSSIHGLGRAEGGGGRLGSRLGSTPSRGNGVLKYAVIAAGKGAKLPHLRWPILSASADIPHRHRRNASGPPSPLRMVQDHCFSPVWSGGLCRSERKEEDLRTPGPRHASFLDSWPGRPAGKGKSCESFFDRSFARPRRASNASRDRRRGPRRRGRLDRPFRVADYRRRLGRRHRRGGPRIDPPLSPSANDSA